MEILEILTEQVLVFDADGEVLVLEDERIEVLDVAEQGPPGPQGSAGGAALQYPAGENLGGHRIVVLDDFSRAVYADSGNLTHANKVMGMTTGAVNLGGMATIQTGGEITEPSWAWALNQPLYLGAGGLLTQAQPGAGFSQIIGFPVTATKIFINLREPILLS